MDANEEFILTYQHRPNGGRWKSVAEVFRDIEAARAHLDVFRADVEKRYGSIKNVTLLHPVTEGGRKVEPL